MVLKEEKLLSSVADRKCKRSLIFPQWPLPRPIYRRKSGTTPGAIPPLPIIASVCTYDAHPRIPCSDNCSAQESLDSALQSIASEKRAIQSLEPERNPGGYVHPLCCSGPIVNRGLWWLFICAFSPGVPTQRATSSGLFPRQPPPPACRPTEHLFCNNAFDGRDM